MARRLKPDPVLFIATVVLVCIGFAWVYSATVGRAQGGAASPFELLDRQLMYLALGIALLLGGTALDYRAYRNKQLIIMLVVITVIALIAVFFGPKLNGSRRWLSLFGYRGVQPSEFAKLVLVFASALLLADRIENNESLQPALVKVAGVFGLFTILIVPEPDLGSVLIMAGVVGVLVFVAGYPIRNFLTAAAISVPLGVAGIFLQDYRIERLFSFMSGEPGHQSQQAEIAIGTGGIFGRGFMEGVQKNFYLPTPQSDFIFAIIAEEGGLIVASVVVICFLIILWRGLRASVHAPDAFGALLAAGITVLIGAQATLNLSVVLRLMPEKGVALPFVSAGGSSLVVSLLAMGILLNVSQHAAFGRRSV